MMMNAICYKTNKPVIYNKGSRYEKSCDTFLAFYTHLNFEDAKALAEKMNNDPKKSENGEIKTYFVNQQEEMY